MAGLRVEGAAEKGKGNEDIEQIAAVWADRPKSLGQPLDRKHLGHKMV
jgi:hypothetical protein